MTAAKGDGQGSPRPHQYQDRREPSRGGEHLNRATYGGGGDGAHGAVQLALLTNKPTLTAADFVVI